MILIGNGLHQLIKKRLKFYQLEPLQCLVRLDDLRDEKKLILQIDLGGLVSERFCFALDLIRLDFFGCT